MLLFGELDTILVPQYFGQYTVEAINHYGCSVFSIPYDYVNSVPETNSNVEVCIYPNPFTTKTYILLPGYESSKWNVEIYNITGSRIMYLQNISEYKIELDMTGYEHGIYFGRITTDDGKTNGFKLILK